MAVDQSNSKDENQTAFGPGEFTDRVNADVKIVIGATATPVTYEVEHVDLGAATIEGSKLTYTPPGYRRRDDGAEFGLVAIISIGTTVIVGIGLMTLFGFFPASVGVPNVMIWLVVVTWACVERARSKERDDRLKVEGGGEDTDG